MRTGEPASSVARGTRTRSLLVASLVLVLVAVTAASLLIVRHRLRAKISRQFSDDVLLSMETFDRIEAQRLQQLRRENTLLANLPTLKALMTTSDERTIANSAIDVWTMSGNDLFALADNHGAVITAFVRGRASGHAPGVQLRADLGTAMRLPECHYLVSEGRLYEFAVRPLRFGGEQTGTLLGYVVNGDALDEGFVRGITRASSVEAAYVSDGRVLVSTLPALMHSGFAQPTPQPGEPHIQTTTVGGEHFLMTQQELSRNSSAGLELVVLKSFSKAERDIREIDRLVVFVGVFATGVGVLLMLLLSDYVTEPLEALANGVRAFGVGDVDHALPCGGTLEIRELSASFARMRAQLRTTNQALLESERLATIGRMAFSVSHDLRHYLSTIYANAEFLASSRLSPSERLEILGDVGAAVHGTTDLLDSLLIFSRTDAGKRRSHELMAALLERTLALVRAHPDAQGVILAAEYGDPVDTAVYVDPRQIERAIFNLLLNACQSHDGAMRTRHVRVMLGSDPDTLRLIVEDDGPGVPEAIRDSLFDPFVSEGKQKGTGLGLTLVHSIASEHEGTAMLRSTRPGATIFQMEIRRVSGAPAPNTPAEAAGLPPEFVSGDGA